MIERIKPMDIEKRSFEIITEILNTYIMQYLVIGSLQEGRINSNNRL